MTERACYTIQEIMELLGIGKSGVYKMLQSGKIPSLKAGKKFVIPRSALHRALEAVGQTTVANSPPQNDQVGRAAAAKALKKFLGKLDRKCCECHDEVYADLLAEIAELESCK